MKRNDMIDVIENAMNGEYNYQEGLAEAIADALILAGFSTYTGPKSRSTDPATSRSSADLIRTRSGSARVRLLEAHEKWGTMTDFEACLRAGLSTMSEYATRCSELRAMGVIVFTDITRDGRLASVITDEGLQVLLARRLQGST